ncbi:MAG TPA: hypothetical protein EYP14_07165 [Planctomycetaceae bacterium]|nr:hypothetical protein [Planctomycetaceae bacterium]
MARGLLDRRRFFQASAASVTAALAGARLPTGSAADAAAGNVIWHNVRDWGVEGKGWSDTADDYDRLPRKAEKMVRGPVWSLSRHSAGMLTRFRTNATAIRVRYRLRSGGLAMPHMPATGVSGLDLYARDGTGRDRWLAVVRPKARNMDVMLCDGIDAPTGDALRLYTLYLPLYNGVESLEIGVDRAFRFEPVPPRQQKPLVFYGTSILQGACASRPGMAFTSIVGRRLNRPVINLGFSGNGLMEPEVGALLCELDADIYIIDCLPNMTGDLVAARTVPLVKQLRAARPDVPILLVEDRTYAHASFRRSARQRHEASRLALRKAFDRLQAEGVEGLHYLEGEDLLGKDGEATTDGSHPNDLGMMRYADAYESILRHIVPSA